MVGIRAIHLIRCSTNVAFRIFLRLRLFHCKIFSKAKYFQMQMILGKKVFFFSVWLLGCIPGNAPANILQCLAQRKKRKKEKSHPNTTRMDKNPPPPPRPTPQPTSTHRKSNPPPESTKNLPRNPSRPTAQNQDSSSKSTKPHQLQPIGNT